MENSSSASHAHTLKNDCRRIDNIVSAIRGAENSLITRHSWLRHQNALGAGILCISLLGMLVSGYFYAKGYLPAWLTILLSAFWASIAHEIEHDLIHRLYFRKSPFIQNVMLAIVWIMRPNTIHPWCRRKLHINHHKTSGQAEDVEERLITNGMKFNTFRLICMFDGFVSTLVRHKSLKESRTYSFIALLKAAFPMMFIYSLLFYPLLTIWVMDVLALSFLDKAIVWPELMLDYKTFAEFAFVVWIAPNLLRSFSLNFISSNMHYFGDVKSVIEQCQILDHWCVLPFQLFCFNFGSTHSIHHFVVGQPFYIRQLVAKDVHPVMIENGVRYNDLGTFFRSNRFSASRIQALR